MNAYHAPFRNRLRSNNPPASSGAAVVGWEHLHNQQISANPNQGHQVAAQVYMLEGSGGNIGVSVGDDGIVIVDDQFAPLAPKIKAALKEITDNP